ncbi:ABC transporter permease [Deinococcus sp. SM5_A1]|uniref:ABC transporter permease n=1 Tax=Deinococcus sp. SM5_A1 TaxID=3379094 RepID=UPI00385B23DF
MLSLLQRFLLFLFVLWGVSATVFLALHLAPGTPAQLLLGPFATPDALRQLTTELGLDQPAIVQYFRWLGHALTGDLGTSISIKQAVSSVLYERLTNSMILAVPAFVVATLLGVSVGLLSGIFRRGWVDHSANILMFAALAVPVFWLGLLLILFFGLQLGWFPTSGMQTPGSDGNWLDLVHHLVLPVIALSLAPAAVVAQITRSTLLNEVKQDYVRTGIAKGLSQRRAIMRHALRNTWIPVVTTLGLEINYVIGGAVLVENVFNWPGIGQLLVQAAISRDYPVVLGASLVLSAIFVAVNFAVEASYGLIDPRLRAHHE